MDENVEVYVIDVALFISKMTIYLAQKAQIALLLAKEVTVLREYTDFIKVFSKKSAKMLPKRTGINEHIIKLKWEINHPISLFIT